MKIVDESRAIKRDLTQLLKMNPLDLSLINQMGIVCYETSHLGEALYWFKKAVDIQPTIQNLNNLGYFYLREGEPNSGADEGLWAYQPRKAIPILEKAISMKPNSHFPYALLGEAYLAVDEFQLAEKVLTQALKMKDTQANQYNLGSAFYEQKKYVEAGEMFRKIVIGCGESGIYRANLNYGVCLGLVGEKKKAEEIAETGLRSSYDEKLLFSEIYYLVGNHKSYVETFPEYSTTYYLDEVTTSQYLYAFCQLGDYSRAQNIFDDYIEDRQQLILEMEQDLDTDEISRLTKIHNIQDEIKSIQEIFDNIKSKNGNQPKFHFNPGMETDCYLFGCLRHEIPEYGNQKA